MNSIFGFMKRAGSALGTFLLGVALTVIQYDAEAATLKPVTELGLRVMMYGIPLISAALQALLWSAYDLEKRMPGIKETLEAASAVKETEAVATK